MNQRSNWQSEPAAVLSIPSAAVNEAIGDNARLTMDEGPAKALLDEIAQFATGDYDPGDVILLVVRPSAYSGLR